MLEIYIYIFFFVEKQFVIYNLSSKLIRNARSVYSSYIYFTFYTLKLKIRFLKRDIVRRVISRIAKLGEEKKKAAIVPWKISSIAKKTKRSVETITRGEHPIVERELLIRGTRPEALKISKLLITFVLAAKILQKSSRNPSKSFFYY